MKDVIKATKGVGLGLLFVVLYFFITAVIGAMYSYMAVAIGISVKTMLEYQMVIYIISAAVTTFVIIYLLKKYSIDYKEVCGFRKPKVHLSILSFASGVSLNILSSAIMEIVPIPKSWEDANTESVSSVLTGNIFVVLIAAMVVVPYVEELIFRGVFFGFVKKSWNVFGAVLVTSIVFGVTHGNILQAIYTFVAAVIFSYCRVRGDSLWCSVLAHIGYNMGGIFVVLLGFASPQMRALIGVAILILAISGIEVTKDLTLDKEKSKQ